MTHTQLERWLESYSKAWMDRDPVAGSELFAPEAEYFETPFDPALNDRDGVCKYCFLHSRHYRSSPVAA